MRIFAGADSTVPSTEGGLRLVEYSVDDRLTSQWPRRTHWGDSGRLLTVERNRAVVWDTAAGVAVHSVRLPESITHIESIAARADLSRAACIVQNDAGGRRVSALLGIDLVEGTARIVGSPPEVRLPFAFADDGETLVAGGELWDSHTWSRRATWLEQAPQRGVLLSHPRRTSVTETMVEATLGNLLPSRGPRLHQRVLPFGPRLLTFREAALDVESDARAARFGSVPGSVTLSARDGTPDVQFDVAGADAIVVVSPNGRWVGTLAKDFILRDTTSAEPLSRLQGTGWANRAILSDDGRTLLLTHLRPALLSQAAEEGTGAKEVRAPPRAAEAWNLATGKRFWSSTAGFADSARLTRDGRFLWAPLDDEAIDLREGRVIRFDRRILSVSPDGMALLDDAWGGTSVVDLDSGRAVLEPRRRSVIVAASGAGHLATRTANSHLQLESPFACVSLLPHDFFLSTAFEEGSVGFSADASTLVAVASRSNGPGRELIAWDANTGVERYSLVSDDRVVARAPLREIRVESLDVYPTPETPPDVVRLDVTNGQRISSRLESTGGALLEYSVPSVSGKRTVTLISADGRWSAAANDDGEFAVGGADGKVVGRAHFRARGDHVRFAWFSGFRRISVQTARGGIFEFGFDDALPVSHSLH